MNEWVSECATETKQILTYKLKDCHDFPNVAFSFICFAFECHSKQSYRNKDLNVEAINSHFQTPIISVCMVCRSHSYTHRLSMFITSITKCDLSIFRCMIDRNKQAGAISEGGVAYPIRASKFNLDLAGFALLNI